MSATRELYSVAHARPRVFFPSSHDSNNKSQCAVPSGGIPSRCPTNEPVLSLFVPAFLLSRAQIHGSQPDPFGIGGALFGSGFS